jgi:P4 family phage/plasmid primase-like protien
MDTTLTDALSIGKLASWYAEQNWRIHPCHGMTSQGRCTCGGPHTTSKDMGKHPATRWKESATSDAAQIAGWWENNPEYNIGVICQPSGFFVIDIDPRSGGDESFIKFENMVEGILPDTVEALTGVYSMGNRTVRGRHLYYKIDENEQLIGNLKAAGLPGIDIKHDGYVLVTPSRHMSGVSYEWKPGHAPWEIVMADAPEELISGLRKRGSRSGGTNPIGYTTGRLSTPDWTSIDGISDEDRVDIDKMLTDGITEGSRAVDIYKMTCAIANTMDMTTQLGRIAVETMMIRFNAEKVDPPLELEGQGGLLGHVQRAIEFVRANPKTSRHSNVQEWERDAAKRISAGTFRNGAIPVPNISSMALPTTSGTSDPDDIDDIYVAPGTVGGAVSAAAMSGASAAIATNLINMDVPLDPDALTEEEGGTPGKRSLSDVGNGRRMIDSFGAVVRYTPGLGWFSWSGNHWETDPENLNIRELTKKVSATVASEAVNYDESGRPDVYRWSTQARSTARIEAAIKNATSDPRIRVAVDKWDHNPNLLGVANGVVDLRTGELLRGRPDLHITRRSPISYTPGIRNPRWESFIDFATGGDKELQEYIQRAVGYTLTGHSNHDAMFLVYGPPGSGKNTFIEAIVKALGTSQLSWPMDSTILAQDDGKSSSTDMYHWAELRGRRMVWVDELPDGERIKENAIKKLTGSSEISARSPGEKPFTFESQAKLWLTTNHRPIITDDAMWRRIRPIPWLNVPEKADPSLKEYLFDPEGGLPAILAWAIEGAIKFMSSPEVDGFGYSKAVHDAAEMYRKSEDRIGMFLSEETVEQDGATIPIKTLFNSYRFWSGERGERPLTQIAFMRKLRDRSVPMKGENARSELTNRAMISKAPSSTGAPDLNWSGMLFNN